MNYNDTYDLFHPIYFNHLKADCGNRRILTVHYAPAVIVSLMMMGFILKPRLILGAGPVNYYGIRSKQEGYYVRY